MEKKLIRQSTFILQVAEAISLLANPIVLLVAAIAFISYRYADSTSEFVQWLIVAIGLLLLPATLYSVTTWVKERQIDLDITNREDRVVPLMLVTLGALIGGYLVTTVLPTTSTALQFMSNVLVAFLLSLTIITLIWKISLHAATLSAIVTLIVLFSGNQFSWLYLALLPVIWARLALKQHTVAQLAAGVMLGVSLTLTAYKIFGG